MKIKTKTGNIELTADEYQGMQDDRRKLDALEAAGVDNWIGYEDAMAPVQAERQMRFEIADAVSNLLFDLSEQVEAPTGRDAAYPICSDEAFDLVKEFIAKVEKIKGE